MSHTNNTTPPIELSIVLPAHNEVLLLGSTVINLVTALEDAARSFELIIVENGSSDATLQLAHALEAQLDNVEVLSLPEGDYGSALRAGFLSARAPVVVNFDVDYYDTAFLFSALSMMEQGADAVLASKRIAGAHDERPLIRRVMTVGFSSLLSLVVGLKVSDTHGMKVLEREMFLPYVKAARFRGSLYDVEVMLRATRAGLDIQEIPARVFERRPPRTSPWRRASEAVPGLIRLRRAFGRDSRNRTR